GLGVDGPTATGTTNASVPDSVAAGNGNDGFSVFSSATTSKSTLMVVRSVAANNNLHGVAVESTENATLWVGQSSITGNAIAWQGILSFGDILHRRQCQWRCHGAAHHFQKVISGRGDHGQGARAGVAAGGPQGERAEPSACRGPGRARQAGHPAGDADRIDGGAGWRGAGSPGARARGLAPAAPLTYT